MKSPLNATLATDPNWVDALPLVLLGRRAAVKNDLHCSVADIGCLENLYACPASSLYHQMVIWLHIQRLWQTCGRRFVCGRYLLCDTAVSCDGAMYRKFVVGNTRFCARRSAYKVGLRKPTRHGFA